MQLILSPDDPAADRGRLLELIDAGATHLVLAPHPPYPPAQRLADDIIQPVLTQAQAPAG
ncbi:MAG TPA: hypothetical protein VGR68_10055 [Actinomycetota bacterium]|nr:hypothetical protein [Actinomycetota bacterium]